jgi:predicted acylesterase/phospholipase RssA
MGLPIRLLLEAADLAAEGVKSGTAAASIEHAAEEAWRVTQTGSAAVAEVLPGVTKTVRAISAGAAEAVGKAFGDGAQPVKKGIAVTWGVAGEDGPVLVGALKQLEEKGIQIDQEVGVSAGSLVATFHTNGFSAGRIATILYREFNKPDGLRVMEAVEKPGNFGAWIRGKAFDHGPFLKRLVDKYDLHPNDKLQIVAYNALSGKPVVFKGENYDLVKAIKASTALPGHLNPVIDWKGGIVPRFLIDGGMHSRAPLEFSAEPTLAFHVEQDQSKLKMAFADSNPFVRYVGNRMVNRVLTRWAQPTAGPNQVVALHYWEHPAQFTKPLTRQLLMSGYEQTERALADLQSGTRVQLDHAD